MITAPTLPPLGTRASLLWLLLAAVSFHAAYTLPHPVPLGLAILLYPLALLQLTRQATPRRAFYWGLAAGYVCFAPQLFFFWEIFQTAAVVLWLILAVWTALFALLVRLTTLRWGHPRALWLAPILWTGLEYSRSELYHLKFSWLNLGYALPPALNPPGMYGTGFLIVLLTVALINLLPHPARPRPLGLFLLTLIGSGLLILLPARTITPTGSATARPLHLTGIQLEFPAPGVIPQALTQALKHHPDTDVFVLSEYSCDGPVSDSVKDWCRTNHHYLVIGGRDPVPGSTNEFYNTAFVIAPDGQIAFRQAKAVPIPFFADGRPAPQQTLWNSPWGPIGICICYDLSFTRVTDRLVAQGARLLIVPTMDVLEWGVHQHQLHARVAPVRAMEYQLPIFRLASSGVSQAIDAAGHVVAATPIGAPNTVISATLTLREPGRLPWDRWLAPCCVSLTGIIALVHLYLARPRKKSQ